MKRLIVAIVFIAISTTAVNAQSSKKSMSIAGNIGLPTIKGFSLAAGADIQGEFGKREGLKITLSVGYENYSIKSSNGGGNTYFIPLMVGAKFPFADKFYGHAQVGYGFGKGGGGGFGYAPSLGYMISETIDVSIKYLAFSNSGTIGSLNLRLAYNF